MVNYQTFGLTTKYHAQASDQSPQFHSLVSSRSVRTKGLILPVVKKEDLFADLVVSKHLPDLANHRSSKHPQYLQLTPLLPRFP